MTEELIRRAEKEYGFRVAAAEEIKNKPASSLVVKLTTDKDARFVLKSLYLPLERQQFIVAAERLLAEKGVGLAKPVKTLGGKLLFQADGVPYVLYEWIEGETGQLRNRKDLLDITSIMAGFHKASRSLRFPPGIKIYGHEHWEKEYQTRIGTMKNFQRANKDSNKKQKKIVCKHLPGFLKIAKEALKLLRNSGYKHYAAQGYRSKSLVHGDLHHQNVIFQSGRGKLIDFEDVRYDLPSKDLLRLYSMYTKHHLFDKETFRSMMETYEKYNPLDAGIRKIVLIDLMFPHIFERLLRKKKYAKMSAEELKLWLRQEKGKADYVYRKYFKKSATASRGDVLEKDRICAPPIPTAVGDVYLRRAEKY